MMAQTPLGITATQCYVLTTMDGLRLIEGVIRGELQPCSRRVHDREFATHIKSGNVFVYEENSTQIKRWTDGKLWSPSRIMDNFLVYREMNWEISFKKGKIRSSRRALNPNSRVTKQRGSDRENVRKPTPYEMEIYGSLVDSYDFHESGLMKKTLSANLKAVPGVSGPKKWKMVAYYTGEDVTNRRIWRPVENPRLGHLQPRMALMTETKFRAEIAEEFHVLPQYKPMGQPENEYQNQQPTGPNMGQPKHMSHALGAQGGLLPGSVLHQGARPLSSEDHTLDQSYFPQPTGPYGSKKCDNCHFPGHDAKDCITPAPPKSSLQTHERPKMHQLESKAVDVEREDEANEQRKDLDQTLPASANRTSYMYPPLYRDPMQPPDSWRNGPNPPSSPYSRCPPSTQMPPFDCLRNGPKPVDVGPPGRIAKHINGPHTPMVTPSQSGLGSGPQSPMGTGPRQKSGLDGRPLTPMGMEPRPQSGLGSRPQTPTPVLSRPLPGPVNEPQTPICMELRPPSVLGSPQQPGFNLEQKQQSTMNLRPPYSESSNGPQSDNRLDPALSNEDAQSGSVKRDEDGGSREYFSDCRTLSPHAHINLTLSDRPGSSNWDEENGFRMYAYIDPAILQWDSTHQDEDNGSQ